MKPNAVSVPHFKNLFQVLLLIDKIIPKHFQEMLLVRFKLCLFALFCFGLVWLFWLY